MIMSNMKKQPQMLATRYKGFEDNPNTHIRELLLQDNLPKDSEKWVSHLTNQELFECVKAALTEVFGDTSAIKTEGEDFDLYCGELFDTIKDKVVEKQAYLVKNFSLVINDEEIKSEVDDYIKRKMN